MKKDQELFSYDTDELQLNYDKKSLELEQLKAEQKAMYKRHEPYKKMLEAYKKAEKLKPSYEAYLAGDESKRDEAMEYEQLEKDYKKYGYTADEIEQYKATRAAEYREMKARIRKGEIAREAAADLAREYVEEPTDSLTAEEEQFYNSIMTTGAAIRPREK